MDNNSSDEQRDDSPHQPSDQQPLEISGSSASQSNSRSSERQRIVQLLQQALNESIDDQPADWVIRAEFYDEDVAQNSDTGDEDDENEHDDDTDGLQSFDDDVDDESVDEPNFMHEIEDIDPDAIIDGFVMPDEAEQSSSDADDDQDQNANYDTTLPVGHRYLGENLEESRGRRVLVENSITSLPLFNFRDVVLFPGQVLPFTTSNMSPRIHSYLETCITRGSTTIGLMSDPQNNQIGTTAEVRNYVIEDRQLRLIMEGRQRFKLISAPFETAIEGEIKILPEVTLGHPYPRISSLLRFYRPHAETPNRFIISKHPPWLLKQYESRNVMKRILDQIKEWCSADLTTKDSNDFSYWVASNLPISNNERMKALSFSCTEARLLWLLEILEKSEFFGCSACTNVICGKKDVFLMSQSGPQCSFVNPGGFIHDTLTVRKARGLIQEYGWSSEYCWFPGYSWRTAHCDNCNRHIGWCYKSLEFGTKPRRFFGLSRANVRLQSWTPTTPGFARRTGASIFVQ